MYKIKQYDPNIFAADGDQPTVHLYAESGNQYVAQYDEDAGYFFTDQALHVANPELLAQEIPGRVYEPLASFEFYSHQGTPVTIQEILDTPALSSSDDCVYEVSETLSRLGFQTDYVGQTLPDLIRSVKVDVSYDYRRGAEVVVYYYRHRPFMVTSNAGRELDDIQRTWILDEAVTQEVASELQYRPEIEEVGRDKVVNLAHWENTPVKLGDRFSGYERPRNHTTD